MVMTRNNILLDRVDKFSNRIIKLYQFLIQKKQEKIMSVQIYRSGTSIGANVYESINAASKADFVNKLVISLKEADETKFWLDKLYFGQYITAIQYDSMLQDNIEIIRLLTSIIKTTKERYLR